VGSRIAEKTARSDSVEAGSGLGAGANARADPPRRRTPRQRCTRHLPNWRARFAPQGVQARAPTALLLSI